MELLTNESLELTINLCKDFKETRALVACGDFTSAVLLKEKLIRRLREMKCTPHWEYSPSYHYIKVELDNGSFFYIININSVASVHSLRRDFHLILYEDKLDYIEKDYISQLDRSAPPLFELEYDSIFKDINEPNEPFENKPLDDFIDSLIVTDSAVSILT